MKGFFPATCIVRPPQKSLQARLSMDIVRHGTRSRFVRIAKGLFYLRDLHNPSDAPASSLGPLGLTGPPLLRPFVPTSRRPRPSTEYVLAVPAELCRTLLDFHGFRATNHNILSELLDGDIKHIPRRFAEETEAYKQLITYVLVTHNSEVLSFQRGRFNRAAEFLRGSHCIGFGGHVTERDYNLFSSHDSGIRYSASRELAEEIRIPDSLPKIDNDLLDFCGLINDNSTPIGRKHIGIVFRYNIPNDDWKQWQHASRNELSIKQLHWINAKEDSINLMDYEYWSQLTWPLLSPTSLSAQPAYRVIRKRPFSSPHLLVVAGGIGSGKSSATHILARDFGYSEINSGRLLANLLNVPPVPITPREKFQALAWNFISQPEGPPQLASALLDAASALGEHRIVIDGVRQLETLNLLRDRARRPLAILFVYANPSFALQLYCARHAVTPASLETEFFSLLEAPVENDTRKMMNEADAVLYNWSGEERYERAIANMAKELGLGKLGKGMTR